jgi:hypothetical protein
MRRSALPFAVLASLVLGGCLRVLGIECEDECIVGDHQCAGDSMQVCVLDFIVTGCFTWITEQDCSLRGAGCDRGSCVCPAGGALCARCTDLASDDLNCGRCGLACGEGRCSSGNCLCDTRIPTVQACGGSPACVDTATDPMHCGSCEAACPYGNEACLGGVCACPPAQPTLCRGATSSACADLRRDPAHCGRCEVACAVNGTCVDGACGCPAGTVLCAAQGVCADLATDPDNCGACGAACPGQACAVGACAAVSRGVR